MKASRTALMVAAYRARASRKETPLCEDPWAAMLAGEDGFEVARTFDEAFPHMDLWIGLRTAFIDRRVRRAMDEGFAQIVVLGAGLDTRAARLAREGVRFFEVDQPASQALKRARLAALDGYPLDAARFAGCDFENQDFVKQLQGVGFDVGAPAFFVWEGVTYYLSEAAVRGTLGRISEGCDPRSVVLFDCVSRRMARGDSLEGQGAQTHKTLGDLGEPMKFGVSDLTAFAAGLGFRHVLSVPFDAVGLALDGSYERGREFRFQRLALLSRATELF